MATQRFYDGQPGPEIRRELNNFEAILDGTVASAQDASTAATSASVKAQQWADAAPGVEVETGKYSAKHWADRAQTTVTGGLIYRGSHSAASGAYPATPSLGDYYKISAAGTLGGVDYSVGDSIIYNGTGWDKIDSTDAVTSVAGRVGEVVLTKGDVGLGNVDNTSDANKPVSTATQTALDGKANTTHTHAIAEVTGLQSALDGKESTITAGTATQYWRGDKTWRDFFTDVRAATLTGLSTATNAVVAATDTVLTAIGKLQKQVSDNLATLTSHTGNTSNPHGVTKVQVGLGNVDNTSDANKPVSTATQNALDTKANTTHTHAVADVSGLQAALDGMVKTAGEQSISGLKTFNNSLVLQGGAPTLFLKDTAHLSSMVHVTGNYFYILRGEVDSEVWTMVNGKWPLVINLTNNDAIFGGNVTAAGNVNTYSDERLKVNWKPVDSGFLDGLANIQSGTYTRKDTGTEQVGVSAQDIQKLLPEAVSADADGFLSLAYGNAALVACVELAKEMVALKKRIVELEGA